MTLDSIKSILQDLENVAKHQRNELAKTQKAIDKAKELLNLVRGGDAQGYEPKPAPTPKPKSKPPRLTHFPTRDAQTAIVQYASNLGRPVTVNECVEELLRLNIVPRRTATTIIHIRELLKMSTQFFERIGERDQTRFIYKG